MFGKGSVRIVSLVDRKSRYTKRRRVIDGKADTAGVGIIAARKKKRSRKRGQVQMIPRLQPVWPTTPDAQKKGRRKHLFECNNSSIICGQSNLAQSKSVEP